jgi:hypothetical protein
MAAAQPRRDTGTDQQPEHEQHRRNRDGTEYEHHLRRPMLAPNPTPDAAKLAGPPRSRSLDYAVAGTGAEGGPPSFDFLAQTCRYGSPTLGFDADRPECEPVSVDMRTSLCPVGIKSAGKGFARARDAPPRSAITRSRRPEVPLRPARMSRKAGGFSRDRRKPHLRGTAWWRTHSTATGLHPGFSDNREINREFFDFGPFSAILAPNRRTNSVTCNKISYATEQGIILGEQGICWP